MQIRIEGVKPEDLYKGSMLKMCFPKEHRRRELQSLAMKAYRNGFTKAGRLLDKVSERYYS